MTKQLLTAASVIAIMGATPAIAKTEVYAKPGSPEAAAQSTGSVTQDAKNAWKDIKEDTSDAYESAKKGTKDTYAKIKETLVSEDGSDFKVTEETVKVGSTATDILGQPVYNNEERVGKVKDIILDGSGNAKMVVIADGDMLGLGKLVAFDYSTVMRTNTEGDIIAPLTENSIDTAAEFSYETANTGDNVKVMPSNGYSVATLLDAKVINSQGKTLGHVNDIQLNGGEADNLIIGVNQIMGIGGEEVAMSFDSADIVKDGDDYNFKLNTNKTANFEATIK